LVCVGVPFQCGYGGVVSLCSLKHGPINIRLLTLFRKYSNFIKICPVGAECSMRTERRTDGQTDMKKQIDSNTNSQLNATIIILLLITSISSTCFVH